MPKSQTKSYPSPAQRCTCAAEGIPHPVGTLQPRVSASVSLEGPRAAAKHQTLPRGLQRIHGLQPGATLPNPNCPAPALSIHRGLTEAEIVVPNASKALRTMRPPNKGHPTNSDSLIQKNRKKYHGSPCPTTVIGHLKIVPSTASSTEHPRSRRKLCGVAHHSRLGSWAASTGRDTAGSPHGDTLTGPRYTRKTFLSSKLKRAGAAPLPMLTWVG